MRYAYFYRINEDCCSNTQLEREKVSRNVFAQGCRDL
jgi:hypothetical protein